MIAEVSEIEAVQKVAATLAAELELLRGKISSYYHEEIELRGDKIMMREYREWFGIEK